jgi:hypothetical protein
MSDRFILHLRESLEPKGILVDDDGRLRVDPLYRGGAAPNPEFIECYNELSISSGLYSKVQQEWADDLVTTLGRLLVGRSSDPTALRAVMFLRIHGFAVDFRDQYAIATSLVRDRTPTPSSPLALATAALGAIDDLLATLSENEQLYAEYRRHVDAHIRQGAYNLQWNRKTSAARRHFTSKFTRKTYDVGDLNERIGTTIAAHGSEMGLTLALAKRLLAPASELARAVRGFSSG